MTTRQHSWTSIVAVAIAAATLALTIGKGGAQAIAARALQAKDLDDTKQEVRSLSTKVDVHEKRISTLEEEESAWRQGQDKQLGEIHGLLLSLVKDRKRG